jgi:hypothetical protein
MAVARKAPPAQEAPAAAKAPARKASAKKAPARKATATARKKTPAAAPAPASATKAAPPAADAKARKPKLVRDSFTIPKSEYSVLDQLKKRAAVIGVPSKKSEVLRAGVKALAAMDDAAFRSAMAAVPTLKPGRPTKA